MVYRADPNEGRYEDWGDDERADAAALLSDPRPPLEQNANATVHQPTVPA